MFDVPWPAECGKRRWRGPRLAGGARSVLLTGPSGAGKSTLLRRLKREMVGRGMRLLSGDIRAASPRREGQAAWVIDLFPQLSTEAALRLLARVGLAEVGCYLQRPDCLSLGQRARLKLALAFAAASGCSGPCVLVVDELASGLDEVTAYVVCRALRRLLLEYPQVTLLAATSRVGLAAPLAPDVEIRCDFGRFEVQVRGERSAEDLGEHRYQQQY
jgi:ABC-type ATPase with predicted acetyltransferase domain